MKIIINNYCWYLFNNILYENADKSGASIHINNNHITKQEFNQIQSITK